MIIEDVKREYVVKKEATVLEGKLGASNLIE